MKVALIVDSDDARLERIAKIVDKLGLVFLIAKNSPQAVSMTAMATDGSADELVVIIANHDLGDSPENGAETIQMVEELAPEIGTILISQNPMGDEETKRFDAVVQSPFEDEQLVEEIIALLR